MSTFEPVLSGLAGLDSMLNHIRLGDNVVWQVDCIEDYIRVVKPYVEQAQKDGR